MGRDCVIDNECRSVAVRIIRQHGQFYASAEDFGVVGMGKTKEAALRDVAVSHSEHEFTLDFVRLDPIQPGKGIVVARVALSPLMVDQLREALRLNWESYAAKAMPQEVRDAGSTAADDDEDDRPESSESGA